MKNLQLNLPTLGFVVATRALLGVGIGLLASDRLPAKRRRKVGLTLALVGAATTIPAVFALKRARQNAVTAGAVV
jgi:hydrogenase/urease accessory protein HupE